MITCVWHRNPLKECSDKFDNWLLQFSPKVAIMIKVLVYGLVSASVIFLVLLIVQFVGLGATKMFNMEKKEVPFIFTLALRIVFGVPGTLILLLGVWAFIIAPITCCGIVYLKFKEDYDQFKEKSGEYIEVEEES